MRLRSTCAAAIAACALPVFAQGLDRDTLLTEAPATPEAGNVRVTGAGGTQSGDPASQSSISATVQWTPFTHFAADIGGYWQGGEVGPSARARYQILEQQTHGVDLVAGLRFKTVGFEPDGGEAELLIAAGRSFGRFDVILNAVLGTETGGPGKDAEVKAFVGYRLTDALRLGLDGRLQAEFMDENGIKNPGSQDLDLVAGPAVSWLITEKLQLQALVGVAKPHGVLGSSATGLLQLSYDF